MKDFAALYDELDRAAEAGAKAAALRRYFDRADAGDREWAAFWLGGERLGRAVSGKRLKEICAEVLRVPPWLVAEAQKVSGDVAETVAMLAAPAFSEPLQLKLTELCADWWPALVADGEERLESFVVSCWRGLRQTELFVLHKMLLGTFRSPVTTSVLAQALGGAEAAEEEWPAGDAPVRIRAVLLYAQRGDGAQSHLYANYTLAVRRGGELVPVARVNAGLPPDQINKIDWWVRRNSEETYGPVRRVRPGLLFELGCEAVRASRRHKSGVELRAPRLLSWRKSAPFDPSQVDELEGLRAALGEGDG